MKRYNGSDRDEETDHERVANDILAHHAHPHHRLYHQLLQSVLLRGGGDCQLNSAARAHYSFY